MNKKTVFLISAIVIILAGLFIYQGINTLDNPNPGIDSGNKNPSENGELKVEDAITLVGEVFDSKDFKIDSYDKKVEIDGELYIVVDVTYKETDEMHKVVVNVVNGEVFSYDGNTLGPVSQIQGSIIEPEVDSLDWNGTYEMKGAKVELLMADKNFFEFTLTTKGEGLEKEFVGVAEIQGDKGIYDDGSYILEFIREADTLAISENGTQPFPSEGKVFEGKYTLVK